MLAKGRDGYHLTHEVEVRSDQRQDRTAVEHGQVVLVDDRTVLESEQAQHKVSGCISVPSDGPENCRWFGMLTKKSSSYKKLFFVLIFKGE